MAGTRHHYVWQMLQRGFSWKENGDDHIWVYRKGEPAKQTVTRKFGMEKLFYGPEGSIADTNITAFENATQGLLQDTRQAEHGMAIDPDIAAAIVSHLEMRGALLRDEVSRVAQRQLKLVTEAATSDATATKFLLRAINEQPEIMKDALDAAEIPDAMRAFATERALANFEASAAEAGIEFAANARTILSPMVAILAETIKSSHNRALEADFSGVERTARHRKLTFSVYRSSEGNLILPDTSIAFIFKNGCAPLSQGEQVEGVIIPISKHVAIIGKRRADFVRDEQSLQRVLAGCSYKAFLADVRSKELTRLSSRIGRNAVLMSDAEITYKFRSDPFFNP